MAQKPAPYSLSGGFCWPLSASDKGNVMLYVHWPYYHFHTLHHEWGGGICHWLPPPFRLGGGQLSPLPQFRSLWVSFMLSQLLTCERMHWRGSGVTGFKLIISSKFSKPCNCETVCGMWVCYWGTNHFYDFDHSKFTGFGTSHAAGQRKV